MVTRVRRSRLPRSVQVWQRLSDLFRGGRVLVFRLRSSNGYLRWRLRSFPIIFRASCRLYGLL